MADVDEDSPARFAADLARRRGARGLSLAEIAAAAQVHRAYLCRIEKGERWPAEPVARLLDAALGAHGVLLDTWRAGETGRQVAAEDARRVATSVRESQVLNGLLGGAPIGEAVTAAEEAVAALAVDYLRQPPGPMLAGALRARSAVVRELNRAPGGGQRRDLIRAAGYLSGILAYATLDMDHVGAAAGHAATGWRCAETIGDRELAAWVRGTQSLIARFDSDYHAALAFAQDGLKYAGAGTAAPRLLAGVAQSQAQLGDRRGVERALDAAEDAAGAAGTDAFSGLFTFTRAKLAYYSGSALIWLDRPGDARRAAERSAAAIALWRAGGPAGRSLDDEALAHVYAATAGVQLGELDAAAVMLGPVLALPAERRIPWLRRRVGRVGGLLAAPKFHRSPAAADLRGGVESFG